MEKLKEQNGDFLHCPKIKFRSSAHECFGDLCPDPETFSNFLDSDLAPDPALDVADDFV
jgi:hypothetical protein